MTPHEIQRLEKEARLRGLSVWELEASQAVDDKLLGDLRDDARRSSPTFGATPLASPSTVRYVELPEDICRVIVMAGGVPSRCNSQIVQTVQRCLREGLSEGHAAAIVAKLLG
jgi:hypothetical protein